MAPMVIDAGVGGLEQSFHHPEAGQSARNADTENEQRASSNGASRSHGEKDISAIVDKIVGLLDDDKKKEGRRAIEKLVQVLRDNIASERRKSGEDEPITKSDLRDLLEIALRSRPQMTPPSATPPPPRPPNTQLGRGGSADT
jgi:hypothetical protein